MPLAFSKAGRKARLNKTKTAAAMVTVAAVAATASVAAASATTPHERPKPDGFGPLPARRYCEAEAMANAAAGLKRYEVIAVDSALQMRAPRPEGRRSVEYAPAFAVPTGAKRKTFDPKAIGDETRRINKLAELDEMFRNLSDAQQKAFEKFVRQKRKAEKAAKNDANRSREEMGDFADDEDGWDDGWGDLQYLEDFLQ